MATSRSARARAAACFLPAAAALAVAACETAPEIRLPPLFEEVPCPLPTTDVRVVEVESNGQIQLALMSDGSLYCWGLGDLSRACAPMEGYGGQYVTPTKSRGIDCLERLFLANGIAVGVSGHGGVLLWGAGALWHVPVNERGIGELPLPASLESAAGLGSLLLVNTTDGLYWHGRLLVMDHPPPQPQEFAEAAELTRVELPGRVVKVAADVHACALVEGGDLYCWGYSEMGELGWGIGVGASQPVKVPAPGPLVDVAATWKRTCALDEAGTAYCAGNNTFGLIGPGYPEEVGELTKIEGLPPLRRVWMGDWPEACGTTAEGELWCWGGGSADFGPEPRSMGISGVVDVAIHGEGACVLREDGAVLCDARKGGFSTRGICYDPDLTGWSKVDFDLEECP